MTGAMYAGVSGLKAHMTALNVIGNNISNVNTLGYKAARYTFNEALYTTSRSGSNGSAQQGGRNPAQIGYGTSIGTIDLDMSTKSYTPTGFQTDCMIDGDGFFILGDKTQQTGITKQSQLQGMTLSRLGNFGFDSEGWLVDGNGSVVYGFLCTGLSPDGKTYEYSPTLTAIRLPQCTNTKAEIYDDNGDVAGTVIQTNVYYPSVNGNGYTVDGRPPKFMTTTDPATGHKIINKEFLDGTPSGYSDADFADLQANYIIVREYNRYQAAADPTTYTLSAEYTALRGQAGYDDLPDAVPLPKPRDKQLADYNEYMNLLKQADAEPGPVNLSSVSIDSTGRIYGIAQDNSQVIVGFVALAKVDNPNGVTHVDGRYFKALGGAGDVHLCSIGGTIAYAPQYQQRTQLKEGATDPTYPESWELVYDDDGNPVMDLMPQDNNVPEYTIESSGDTELVTGGLESSGTDLATEISNMIIIQRGYQANTRIVTVTDSMLEELVNMKR